MRYLEYLSPTVILVLIILGQLIGLAYLALLHHVWGGRYYKQIKSNNALYLKTKCGEYRFDGIKNTLNVKEKSTFKWRKINFEDIVGISRYSDVDTASWIEFFLSDFSLWDFMNKNRDLLHQHHISIRLKDNTEIPLTILKQYEQREWLLGQYLHNLQIWIIRKLGWYHDIDDISEEWITKFRRKVRPYGLRIKINYF